MIKNEKDIYFDIVNTFIFYIFKPNIIFTFYLDLINKYLLI